MPEDEELIDCASMLLLCEAIEVDVTSGRWAVTVGELCATTVATFLLCLGEEWGLCFSVRDNVLLRACREDVAMLKSPTSCWRERGGEDKIVLVEAIRLKKKKKKKNSSVVIGMDKNTNDNNKRNELKKNLL